MRLWVIKPPPGKRKLGARPGVAFLAICRLWSKQRLRKGIAFRLLWSVLLLFPLLGPVLYFFIAVSPNEHPYDPDTMRSDAESVGDRGPYY